MAGRDKNENQVKIEKKTLNHTKHPKLSHLGKRDISRCFALADRFVTKV